MPVLEAETSTGLTRTTVHSHNNGRVFGLFILNNLVPIVLHIHTPGPAHYSAVLVFGDKYHCKNPYEDFGLMTKECRKVFGFNVRHYIQCYLPAVQGSDGNPTVPYTYNLCEYCGASVQDDNGRILQQIRTRSYRPDKFIWKASAVLQDKSNLPVVFTEGAK